VRFGGGREGDGVLAEELAGEAEGVGDGGAVDAEEDAGDERGQVQVVVEAEGPDVAGQVGPAAAVGAAAGADGVHLAAAAAGVVALFAAGAERDFQGGGQRVQVLGGHAGECGVVQGVPAGRAGRRGRFRCWLVIWAPVG
jgi:hypothetical protein